MIKIIERMSYEQELREALNSIKYQYDYQYNNTNNIKNYDIDDLFVRLVNLSEEIMQAYTLSQLTKPSRYYNKGYYIGEYLAGMLDGLKSVTKDEKIMQIAVSQIAAGINTNIIFKEEY